jgi:hypothetical protein
MMGKYCRFCSALAEHEIDGLDMCKACAKDWLGGHAEDMAEDLAIERMERQWDPGYIYDLTHHQTL